MYIWYVRCPALLLNMIKLNEKVHNHASWHTHKKKSWYDYSLFSPFEMHTDKSTNCTLLGPVDCDSFYKWIPLNRWPVAISSEVLHFIYCAFLSSLSLFNMCSSHYSLFFIHLPPRNDRAGSKVASVTAGDCIQDEFGEVLCLHLNPNKDQLGRLRISNKFNCDQFVGATGL